MKHIITLLFCLCANVLFSQNLISNSGFEENDFGQVRDWKQPIEDYYHYEVQLEQNDSQVFYNSINGLCLLQPDASEFMTIKLKQPLIKGKRYCASLNVYPRIQFYGDFKGVQSIDFAFTDSFQLVWRRRKFFMEPKLKFDFVNDSGKFYQPQQLQFVADGTEQYLLIGKFHVKNVETLSYEEKRYAIYREQYYAADSIKKYYATLVPKREVVVSKRAIKKETRRIQDSIDKIETAKIIDLHSNADLYREKVALLPLAAVDTMIYHVRVFIDNVCIAPVKKNNTCACNETLVVAFEKGQTYRLNNILFDLNKATFKSTSYAEMDNLVIILQQHPKMEIQLNGHTDSLNSEQYNLDLSNRRAKAVYDYLIEKGITANRLKWKGFGETFPLTSNETDEGKAINRRVEFLILKNEE